MNENNLPNENSEFNIQCNFETNISVERDLSRLCEEVTEDDVISHRKSVQRVCRHVRKVTRYERTNQNLRICNFDLFLITVRSSFFF